MQEINNQLESKSSAHRPPQILKGLIPLVVLLVSSILSLSWYIIDYQVEKLVAKRTSEYAHSIVKIAADASAEALLSDDILQLDLLAQSIAKDRYIHSATIYNSDGIVVTLYPPEKTSSNQSTADESNELTQSEISASSGKSVEKDNKKVELRTSELRASESKATFDYLAAKKNIPFTEKIAFKGVTAGWFKIEIDGLQLESDFRANFHRIRERIFALGFFLILSLIYILFRYRRNVNKLVNSVHLLVRRKAVDSEIGVASSQALWFEQVDNLTEASFSKPIRLRELRQHVRWQGDEAIESVPLVWFAIDLPKQDSQGLAEKVVKIEKYVKSATNAYYTFFQGEIFAGGVVPFLQHSTNERDTSQSSFTDLISFTYLLKELMDSMDANIKFKAILFNSRVNKLYSDDSMQNRVILPQRKQRQINKLSNILNESSISCLVTNPNTLDELAEYEIFIHKEKTVSNTYLLREPNHDIINHVARISKTIIESDIRN